MTRSRLAALSLFSVALCATSVEIPTNEPEERTLEEYVHILDLQCESQIEEIAAALPQEQVPQLRREHYAWKLHRDRYCAEESRQSSDRLSELRCLAKLTGSYFDQREIEISTIKENQPKQDK